MIRYHIRFVFSDLVGNFSYLVYNSEETRVEMLQNDIMRISFRNIVLGSTRLGSKERLK